MNSRYSGMMNCINLQTRNRAKWYSFNMSEWLKTKYALKLLQGYFKAIEYELWKIKMIPMINPLPQYRIKKKKANELQRFVLSLKLHWPSISHPWIQPRIETILGKNCTVPNTNRPFYSLMNTAQWLANGIYTVLWVNER
jgi:hypothetical protein